MIDEFEAQLHAAAAKLARRDPTPAWKIGILARATREPAPRWPLVALAAAWALIGFLRATTPRPAFIAEPHDAPLHGLISVNNSNALP